MQNICKDVDEFRYIPILVPNFHDRKSIQGPVILQCSVKWRKSTFGAYNIFDFSLNVVSRIKYVRPKWRSRKQPWAANWSRQKLEMKNLRRTLFYFRVYEIISQHENNMARKRFLSLAECDFPEIANERRPETRNVSPSSSPDSYVGSRSTGEREIILY